MGEAEVKKIVQDFLQSLVDKDIVENEAIAVLFGRHIQGVGLETDPIEVLVISSRFGSNMVEEGRSLIAATWDIDPLIVPTAVSESEWTHFADSIKLTRAKQGGIEIRL